MIEQLRFEDEVARFGRFFEKFNTEQKVIALRFLLSLINESMEKQNKEGDGDIKKEEKEPSVPIIIGICNELGKHEWARLSRTNSGGSMYDIEKFRQAVVERAKRLLRNDLQEIGLKEGKDFLFEEISADESPPYRTVWIRKFDNSRVIFSFDDINNMFIMTSQWWWRKRAADFLMGKTF